MANLVTVEGGAMLQGDLIARAVADWVEHCDVAPVTQKVYNSAMGKFIAFVGNNGFSINEAALKSFREFCKQTFSTSSARLYFQIARKFCQFACKKMNVGDFTAGLRGVKSAVETHNRDAISMEDAAAVIDGIKGADFVSVRNRLLLILATEMGLRRVELHRLNLNSIQLRRGKYFLNVWGKARSGPLDFVPLPKHAKKLLDEYLKLRQAYGVADENAPLFISVSDNSRGKRLGCDSISRIAKKALVNAGFDSKRLTCHSLRHSFASAAIQEKVDIRTIQKTLRHRSQDVTEIYLHDEAQFGAENNATEIVAEKLASYLKGEN